MQVGQDLENLPASAVKRGVQKDGVDASLTIAHHSVITEF